MLEKLIVLLFLLIIWKLLAKQSELPYKYPWLTGY